MVLSTYLLLFDLISKTKKVPNTSISMTVLFLLDPQFYTYSLKILEVHLKLLHY